MACCNIMCDYYILENVDKSGQFILNCLVYFLYTMVKMAILSLNNIALMTCDITITVANSTLVLIPFMNLSWG